MHKPAHPTEGFLHPRSILRQAGVQAGHVVADIGCGSGDYVIAAAKMVGSDGKAYGVDVLEGPLSVLRSKASVFGLDNVYPFRANAEAPASLKAIPDASVDFVLLTQLFCQTEDHQAVMAGAARLLAPEGKIVVVEWKKSLQGFGPPHGKYVTATAVRTLAGQSGFIVERELDAGPYHYGLLLSREK